MMNAIWRFLVGIPLSTQQMRGERIGRGRALAALSPDALSSIAYANQEIYLGLVVAGASGLAYSWPIALAIVLLLLIVSLSYTQIIRTYPAGGGAYTVARENLGTAFGLIAAAALFINYVLAAAVSLTAGVAAIASAFPALWPYQTWLALALLAVITVVNLRGTREAGFMLSIPVYFFLVSYIAMLLVGLVRAVLEGPGEPVVPAGMGLEAVTLVMLLHTFSSGCTALTGIEAISNGVQIFKPPEARHANQTMVAMTAFMAILFLGSIGLTQFFGITAGPEETILSALARRVLGPGLAYLLVQVAMLLVLVVGANTAFVGFPRLASLLAQDGYMPRQLTQLGDRLVFSNGILSLAGLTALLIVVFGGDTHALVPLFAVGAFLAFTLSQAGMVAHDLRHRGPGWQWKTLLNALGTLTTGLTLLVVTVSKFLSGAWVVLVLLPILLLAFYSIKRHYQAVAAQLSLGGLPPDLKPLPEPRIVLPVSGVHRGMLPALRYACALSDHVTAVFVEVEPGSGARVDVRWHEWGLNQYADLVIVPSPYRSVVGPLIDFLDRTDHEHNDGQLASIVLPQFVPAHWWEVLLHNQTAWVIRLVLLYRRRAFGKTRAIIDVPLYLKR